MAHLLLLVLLVCIFFQAGGDVGPEEVIDLVITIVTLLGDEILEVSLFYPFIVCINAVVIGCLLRGKMFA